MNNGELVRTLMEEAADRTKLHFHSDTQRPGVHHTELPENDCDSPIATEWNTYRREIGRLLAEGQEGKWVLIKGGQIIGLWDTEEGAEKARVDQFLMQNVLLKQIREYEPPLRVRGVNYPWQS